MDSEKINDSFSKEELENTTKEVEKSEKKADKASGSTDHAAAAREAKSNMQRLAILDQLRAAMVTTGSPQKNQKDMADHKFWSTQPVPKHGEVITEDGPIEPSVPKEQVRQMPFPLPKEFEWVEVNMNSETELKELYELLTSNYVEDDDATFRFDYSAAFLKWALQPPGYLKSWHVGVRVVSNKKLVAFIAGTPAAIRSHQYTHHLTEINYLCVHKKLRSKRLAPVLIKEITRRSHLEGVFQAVYTAGVVLPKPIATCRYYHRSLNPKKLIETNFSRMPRNQTMPRYIKSHSVGDKTTTPGWRAMREEDVPQVRLLLNEYLSNFDIAPVFETDEDVRHWLLPVPGVIWSYVVGDLAPSTKSPAPVITDFISFYSLPSSVIGNAKHKTLNAAYLFYLATSVKGGSMEDDKFLKGRLQSLVKDALVVARNLKFDVFNCLDLMNNDLFVQDLKFGKGDGSLNYYLYNWRCRDIKHEKVGLVML